MRIAHYLLEVSLVFIVFLIPSTLFAQDIPDSLLPPNSGYGQGGDTIISSQPIIDTKGHHAPAITSQITAINFNNYIVIISSSNVTCTYAIRDENYNYPIRNQINLSANTPVLIELVSIPISRYTLLLYINNECLEGEFYKE